MARRLTLSGRRPHYGPALPSRNIDRKDTPVKRLTFSLVPLALAAAALAACGGGARQDAATPAGSAQAPAAAQTAPTPLTEAPADAQAPAAQPQPVEHPASAPPAEEPMAANGEFAGAWRAYSARIF